MLDGAADRLAMSRMRSVLRAPRRQVLHVRTDDADVDANDCDGHVTAKRPHRSKITMAHAACQGCAWTAGTTNALGLAAQHHDATKHVVESVVTMKTVYGMEPDA